MPPTTSTGQDVAIVWIHGAQCDNYAYEPVAAQV